MRSVSTILIVGIVLAVSAIAAAWGSEDRIVHIGERDGTHVRVLGCESEDDCVIDYRGRRNHDGGVWVITQVTP